MGNILKDWQISQIEFRIPDTEGREMSKVQ